MPRSESGAGNAVKASVTAPQILIVDGTRKTRESLGACLRKAGMRVRKAASSAEARHVIAQASIQLALVETVLPDDSGLRLCRFLADEKALPVILLSPRMIESELVAGLGMGADDYICKPVSPPQLLARIHVVLRRAYPQPPRPPTRCLRFGDLLHDGTRGLVVTPEGAEIALTTTENLLLGMLLQHPDETLSRMRLLDLLKGREARIYDRAVDNTVSRLRRKLGNYGEVIVTDWGLGYRIGVPVSKAAAAGEVADRQTG